MASRAKTKTHDNNHGDYHYDLRPKGRGTKASGGVRHSDWYKGIFTDLDVYIFVYDR